MSVNEFGADIINDVSEGEADYTLFRTVAAALMYHSDVHQTNLARYDGLLCAKKLAAVA